MPDKYLVSCKCGKQIPATVHQAGSQITCTCGDQVDVPPLRKLKQLPAADDRPLTKAKKKWTPRHSIAMGGAAIAAALLVWSAYLWLTEPPPPTFSMDLHRERVEEMLETGTPLLFWRHWIATHDHLAEHGFEEMTSPRAEALEAYIAERQFFRNMVAGAAVVVAALTIIAWLVWPKSAV